MVGVPTERNKIVTPIIAVCGISPMTQKFDVQLYFRDRLMKDGYKVSQIGTKEISYLFGFQAWDDTLYDNSYSEPEKIGRVNQYIKDIEAVERPDVFVIGVPDALIPYTHKHTFRYGIPAYEIFSAVTPDFVVMTLFNIKYLLSGIIPSTKRYYDFLSEPEESSADGKELPVWDEIIFDKVAFSYDEKIPAVEDINLCILKGHKIAFVGKNGCGKSTLIKLLLRLRKPQVGNIRVGDINIEEISLIKYRELFSVVSQDVYLFNDTIRNNIRLYKDIDDETINKACEDSGLVDFIKEVSLDYNVGANGAMLSGGQKQKVALARALVLDRPMFLLDEATSNADVSSELQINSLLRTRLKEKTVIVISHRESVLKEMNHIILIDAGKVVWNSGYEELIESDLYKQIQREL